MNIHKHIGKIDQEELIRIAIIEGEIEGQDSGYSVHITSNHHVAIKNAESRTKGLPLAHTMFASRIHRMNPAPGSIYLSTFKKHYLQHKKSTKGK